MMLGHSIMTIRIQDYAPGPYRLRFEEKRWVIYDVHGTWVLKTPSLADAMGAIYRGAKLTS